MCIKYFQQRKKYYRNRSGCITLDPTKQGCQMVYFETKKPILGNFRKAFKWKMVIWNIRTFGMFNCHLVMLWKIGIFLTILVYCVKKDLATLLLFRWYFFSQQSNFLLGFSYRFFGKQYSGVLCPPSPGVHSYMFGSGLPDGLFSNQKSQFG
jgi:hypothetical protein